MYDRLRHVRVVVSLLSICTAFAVTAVQVGSQSPPRAPQSEIVDGHEAVAREVLVQFTDTSSPAERRMMGQQVDADVDVPVGRGRLRRFHSRIFDVDTLVSFFRTQPGVEYAEPNYILHAVAVPNDPLFPDLWGLRNTGQFGGTPGADIHATSAWSVSTGSRANVVAIVDTGIDYTHPDLAANVWSAPGPFTVTIGADTFTCPAGSHGFNAIPKPRTAATNCNPMDDNNHGSHVSGTIGAAGNNASGVAGVNWTASLIGAKFLGAGGSGSTSDAIDAIDFLIQTKTFFAGTSGANVRVINNSWGGGGFSTALRDAIANAYTNDMLFVAAAGNAGVNTDLSSFYPAGYAVDNVIAVAATDNNDFKASFSNYGVSSVDLAAPGVSIESTVRGGGYSFFNGTSMATPHVAGAAALVLSACSLTTDALKDNLLSTVDVLGSLSGLVHTSGRLNVDRAIRSCGTPVAPAAPTGLIATAADSQVQLAWTVSPGATSYKVKRSTASAGPYTTIATGVTATSHLDGAVTNGVTYFYVVSAVNSAGESANSSEVSATPFASVPSPPQSLAATAGDAQVSLAWLPSSGATAYRVNRSLTKSGPFTQIAEVPGTGYVDTTVANGTKYWYYVTAVNAAGESGRSNKDSAVPRPIPLPPTGVSASPGVNAGEITVTWSASAWATSYKVKRATMPGGPYAAVKKTTGLSITEAGLTSGRTYYLVVTALNSSGESGPSLEVSAAAR